jgi:hypothetical protein
MKLLRRTALTALRYSEAGGEYNEHYEWIDSEITEVPFKCSLQPINRGQDVMILPEGISAKDAYLVLTETKLLEDNEFSNQKADEVDIKGIRFKAHNVSDWTGYGLKSDHYRAILIRSDKDNENS